MKYLKQKSAQNQETKIKCTCRGFDSLKRLFHIVWHAVAVTYFDQQISKKNRPSLGIHWINVNEGSSTLVEHSLAKRGCKYYMVFQTEPLIKARFDLSKNTIINNQITPDVKPMSFQWSNIGLTLMTLKYLYIKHGDQRVFSIWNHHECLI